MQRLDLVLLALGAAGALLLFISEFLVLVKVTTAQGASLPGGIIHGHDRGWALAILAVAAGVMVVGLARRSRPAAAAVTLLGVIALAIALIRDVPDLHKVGLVKPAANYLDAKASAGSAIYFETGGAILLILSGGGALLLWPNGRRAPAPRRRPAAEAAAGASPSDQTPE